MRLSDKDKRLIVMALDSAAAWESSYADSLRQSNPKWRAEAEAKVAEYEALRTRLRLEWKA